MRNKLNFFFRSNEFSNDSFVDARRRKTLNLMIMGLVLIMVLLLISMMALNLAHVQYTGQQEIYRGISIAMIGIILLFLIERYLSSLAASVLFTVFVSATILISDTPRAFVEGQSVVFLVFPVVVAGFLIRPWASYAAAGIVIVAETIGYFYYHTGVPNISALLLFFLLAWVIQQSTSNLEHALEKEQKKSRALQESEKAIGEQNQRIQEISQKLVEVQEREKHVLAAELHDDLGQSLTSLKLTLEMIRRAPSSTARQEKISEAGEMVAELMNKVRNLSLDLRPAMLDDFGLFAALRWWFELFQTRAGISIHCNYDPECKDRFKPQVETAAFRIIQEALTNVARHASVGEAQVNLSMGSILSIEVSDQGAGFDVAQAIQQEEDSVGLSGMQERVRLLGGTLEVLSSPGAGTRVLATIPCQEG